MVVLVQAPMAGFAERREIRDDGLASVLVALDVVGLGVLAG